MFRAKLFGMRCDRRRKKGPLYEITHEDPQTALDCVSAHLRDHITAACLKPGKSSLVSVCMVWFEQVEEAAARKAVSP